jgi:hypothetical protein
MQNFLGKNLHVIINHVYSIQKHTKTLFSFPNKEKHLQFVIFPQPPHFLMIAFRISAKIHHTWNQREKASC